MLPCRAIAPQAATQTATRQHLLTVTRGTETAPPDMRGLDGGASPSSSAVVVPGKVTCSRKIMMPGDVTAQWHVQAALACGCQIRPGPPVSATQRHVRRFNLSNAPSCCRAQGFLNSKKPTGSSAMRSLVLVLLPPPPPPPSMVCVDTALPPEVRAEGYCDDTSSTCGRHDKIPTSPSDCLRDRSR